MKLDRPLIFFDLETTGPEIDTDRIVQFAAIRITPSGARREWQTLVNPLMPIPPAATKVHGITDEQVQSAPTFARLAARIAAAFEGADLGGYNARKFDVPLLINEFRRAGVKNDLHARRIVDPMKIFMLSEPRDLAAATIRYLGHVLEGAHDALNDARAAAAIFEAQVQAGAVPADIEQIAAICADGAIDLERKLTWDEDEAVIAFGKQRGKSLRELAEKDRGFLEWMLSTKAAFPEDTKTIIAAALAGEFPRRTK